MRPIFGVNLADASSPWTEHMSAVADFVSNCRRKSSYLTHTLRLLVGSRETLSLWTWLAHGPAEALAAIRMPPMVNPVATATETMADMADTRDTPAILVTSLLAGTVTIGVINHYEGHQARPGRSDHGRAPHDGAHWDIEDEFPSID